MFWTYILPLIVSIAAVSIIHPQLVKIALRKHIVDEPNARKFQEHPVPTMGGIARVRLHYTDLPSLIKLSDGTPVYGTLLDGDDMYTQSLSETGLIVMGNEGKGISDEDTLN